MNRQEQDTPACERRNKKGTLKFSEKISVIRENEKGYSMRKLAAKYRCSKTQIQRIVALKEKYLKVLSIMEEKEKNNIRKQARLVILEAAVHEWIQRSRGHGQSIDDDEIGDIAFLLSQIIGLEEFQPTDLWLQLIKKKFNIHNLDPLPTNDDMLNTSLNIVDILFDMKDARTDLGFPLLFEYIIEQLEISCATAAPAKSCTNIGKHSENTESEILENVIGEIHGECNQDSDSGEERTKTSVPVLQEKFGYQANPNEIIENEDTYVESSQSFSLKNADSMALEIVDDSDIDEKYQRNNKIRGSHTASTVVLDLNRDEADLQKNNTVALELIENFDIDKNCGRSSEECEPQQHTSVVLNFDEDESEMIKIEVLYDESDDDKVRALEHDLTPPISDTCPRTTEDILELSEEEEEYQIEKDKLLSESAVAVSTCTDEYQTNNCNNVESEDVSSPKMGIEERKKNSITKKAKLKPIISYRDAIKRLGPLENFVSTQRNIRAVAIINQLEKIFIERMTFNE